MHLPLSMHLYNLYSSPPFYTQGSKRTKTDRNPLNPKQVQCFAFYWMFSCSLNPSRVPPPQLHQQTTSWFVPAEWGDRRWRGVRPPPCLQKTRPRGNNLWCLITCTTSMYPWSPSVLSNWTPLNCPAQLMVSSSDLWLQMQNKIKASGWSFWFWKGSRAGLGSSPSMEGPVDPSGPTEYTEQTLDADSQVGIFLFRSTSFLFLPELKINLFLNL